MSDGYTKIVFGDLCYYNAQGEWHREGAPAIEAADGSKYWVVNGKHHRLDGPAIEHIYGDKWWYFNGKEIPVNSQEEFEQYLRLLAFV